MLLNKFAIPISLISIGFLGVNGTTQANNQAQLATGLFYSDGQSEIVNSNDVSALSVPLLISVKKEKLSFGVSMSYLSLESGELNEKGIGDTTLSLGYDVQRV